MSTTAIDIGTLVVSTPETCGGRPRIAGTRISIAQIAVWHQQGMSPEAILEEISYLNLAQIYAALSYYHANRKEIEADLAAELAEYDRLEADRKSAEAMMNQLGFLGTYIRSE